MGVRQNEWAKVRTDYIRELDNNEKHLQKKKMEAKQKIKFLQKRQKEGEIVLLVSDKTNKIVVMWREPYLVAGSVHTNKDREVDFSFAEEDQRVLNGHTSSFIKIFGVGEDWGHGGRHREVGISHAVSIPDFSLFYKDHKG